MEEKRTEMIREAIEAGGSIKVEEKVEEKEAKEMKPRNKKIDKAIDRTIRAIYDLFAFVMKELAVEYQNRVSAKKDTKIEVAVEGNEAEGVAKGKGLSKEEAEEIVKEVLSNNYPLLVARSAEIGKWLVRGFGKAKAFAIWKACRASLEVNAKQGGLPVIWSLVDEYFKSFQMGRNEKPN